MSKDEIKNKSDIKETIGICVLLAALVFSFVSTLVFCMDNEHSWRIFAGYAISIIWTMIFFTFPKNKLIDYICGGIIVAGSPVYILYLILNNDSLKSINEIVFNSMIILLALCVVFMLTQSTKWAISLVASFCWLFYIIDEIVVACRNTPIIPNDIFSLSSALTVSNQYSFGLNEGMITSTVTFVIIVMLAIRFDIKKRPFSFKLCWLPVIPMVAVLLVMNNYSEAAFKTVDNFDTASSNKKAGVLNTFIVNAKNMVVDKPEAYNKKQAKESLEKYSADIKNVENSDTPNVIVVMNEAFSDLRNVGKLETNIPFMSYIDSMEENTIKGNMLVSVLGGNTCNTEYEFLTGNSLNFLPKGYIPYIRTITHETPNICNQFKEMGYKNIAIHPYMPECWRRNQVYPLLGFDEFISGYDFDENYDVEQFKMRGSVDFGDLEYIRKYVSDSQNYKKVIDTFENKGDDKVFIFNVTMQNHGPYTYSGSDFIADVQATNLKLEEKQQKELNQYLSLIRKSDMAFGELIEYFKAVDEKTVIVMFGDHLPGFSSSVFNEIYEKGDKKQDLKQLKYTVPFVIWANYDIQEDNVPITGANYLSSHLMDIVGMPKSGWDNLRKSAEEKYPAMNYYGAYDADGNWIDREKLQDSVLTDYENIQYGKMFDNLE